MKRNCRFLIVLSLFAWMGVGLKAQDRLVVQMKNGAQTQYDLSQLKKADFLRRSVLRLSVKTRQWLISSTTIPAASTSRPVRVSPPH